jgi:hypothetical protein
MSSLPNLLPKFGTWATGTNYPGSAPPAWNGQPIKVAPAYSYFSPNVKLAADALNYLFNDIYSDLAVVQNSAIFTALSQWGTSTAGSVVDIKWDPFWLRWVAVNAAGAMAASYDGGKTFNNDGFSGTPPLGNGPCIVNPSTGVMVVFNSRVSGSGGPYMTLISASGAMSTVADTAGMAAGDPNTAEGAFFNGLYIFVTTQQPEGLGACSSPDGTNWTNLNSAIPSTMQGLNLPTSHLGRILTTGSASLQLFAYTSDGTSGTHTGMMMTTDGATFTDVSPSVMSGDYELTGLHYNPADGNYAMLLAYTAGSPFTLLYVTSNPSNPSSWTLVHTFNNYTATGISAVGPAWVVLAQASTASPTTKYRLFTSVNPTVANSWTPVPFPLFTAGSTFQVNPIIRNAQGAQLLIWDDSYWLPGTALAAQPTPSGAY